MEKVLLGKRRRLDRVRDDIKYNGLSADDRATWRHAYVIVGTSTQDKSGNKMAMKKKNIVFIM